MSGLIEFSHYQAEALLICLAGSLVWASVLFLGARGLERSAAMTSAEKLWTAALLFAVLPSLAAPTLAAFGVSLRPAPAPVEFESLRMVATAAAPLQEAAAADKPALVTAEQAIGASALLYVYGVFLAFFLWAARQAGLQYAVARAETVRDGALLDRIEDWAERLRVPMPAIRRSRHVSSVCITGVIRQTVLIPHGIEARVSSDDLVLMCAHELAHVRRGDTRLFTATQLARVLFWFNPLVARIAAHAELAAEESADALVLQKGVDRRAYAACFVEGLKFAAYKMNAQPALAPSFTPPDRHGRRRRLNSILAPEPARKAPLARRLMLSAAASSVALVAVGQAALAVDPESAGERRSTLRNLPLIGDITMGFGERSADIRNGAAHDGVDIKAPKGAKVFAPGDGVVVEATDLYNGSPAWGKVVVIDHGHGLVTRYAHLDSYRVKRGQRVKTGDVIAAVGATGKVTGPHLHFETLRDGEAVDPADVVALAPDAPDAAVPPEAPAPFDVEPAVAPFDAEPTVAPFDAEPAEAPTPAASPAPAAHPAPEAAGVREFGRFENFRDFKLINPVIAGTPLIAPRGFSPGDGTAFAFGGGEPITLMIDDMEERLLGAIDGEVAGSYDLTFRSGDKVYRFSSSEPMTAEKRAEMREALKEMRKQGDKARKDAAKLRAEAEKHREAWRAEMARVRAEASDEARRDAERGFALSAEDLANIRRETRLSRREELETQREALEDARADLENEFEIDIEDALADLDDAESDLDDADLSREERAAARASLREQRRQLQQDGEVHKRAIESARRQIEVEIERVDRALETLGDED